MNIMWEIMTAKHQNARGDTPIVLQTPYLLSAALSGPWELSLFFFFFLTVIIRNCSGDVFHIYFILRDNPLFFCHSGDRRQLAVAGMEDKCRVYIFRYSEPFTLKPVTQTLTPHTVFSFAAAVLENFLLICSQS